MNEFDFLPVAYASAAKSTETTAATEAGGEAGAKEGGLEIQPSTIAFQAFNFLLLVVVLHKILYKPMLKLLKDREKRISDGVENAEKADGMLKESNIIRQDMIKRANSDSQEILEKARKAGEEVKTGLVQDAHKEAGNIIKAGQNLIEMEKTRTAQELKGLAVSMIVTATEKILREKLDAEKDGKLISESLQAHGAN